MFTLSDTMLSVYTNLFNLPNTTEHYHSYFTKEKTERLNTLSEVSQL